MQGREATREMPASLLHVMVTAYGRSPFLRATLNSVVNQCADTTPVTVIDDGTPGDVVKDIVESFEGRIGYVKNHQNLGVSGAFNEAIRLSSGEFTLILGSDDLLVSDPLAEVENVPGHMRKTLVGVHLAVAVVDENGKRTRTLADLIKKRLTPRGPFVGPQRLASTLAIGDWAYHPAIAWRTDWSKTNPYDLRLKTAMDLDLLFRAAHHGLGLWRCSTVSVLYRRHAGSVSSVARGSSRVREELTVHARSRALFRERKWYLASLLLELAPTVRAHGLATLRLRSLRSSKPLLYLLFAPNQQLPAESGE